MGFREKNHKKRGSWAPFLCFAAVVYFGSGFLIEALSQRAVPVLTETAARSGIEISVLRFENPGLGFPFSVKWEDVVAETRSRRGMFAVKADRLMLSFSELIRGRLVLTVSGFNLTHLPAKDDGFSAEETKSFQGNLRYAFKINFFPSPKVQSVFRPVINDLVRFIREGRSGAEFECKGTIYFSIKDQHFEAELFTKHGKEGSRLMMSEESVRRVTSMLKEEMTPAEISLMAENPVRVPRLYQIKEYAVKKSEKAAKRDSSVPQDAYKHVLWSYLLTKEYGRDFAKHVTDAHEVGSRKNTPADHAMDYQNNLVGQRYAEIGVSEKDILGRMLQDPAIIREPEHVFRKSRT